MDTDPDDPGPDISLLHDLVASIKLSKMQKKVKHILLHWLNYYRSTLGEPNCSTSPTSQFRFLENPIFKHLPPPRLQGCRSITVKPCYTASYHGPWWRAAAGTHNMTFDFVYFFGEGNLHGHCCVFIRKGTFQFIFILFFCVSLVVSLAFTSRAISTALIFIVWMRNSSHTIKPNP